MTQQHGCACVCVCARRVACKQKKTQLSNRMVSLDGKRYNFRRGMHTKVFERTRPSMHWATLPADALLRTQLPLDNKLAELQVGCLDMHLRK